MDGLLYSFGHLDKYGVKLGHMYVGGLANAVDLSLSLPSCETQTMLSPNCAVLLNKRPGVACGAPLLHHGLV